MGSGAGRILIWTGWYMGNWKGGRPLKCSGVTNDKWWPLVGGAGAGNL